MLSLLLLLLLLLSLTLHLLCLFNFSLLASKRHLLSSKKLRFLRHLILNLQLLESLEPSLLNLIILLFELLGNILELLFTGSH